MEELNFGEWLALGWMLGWTGVALVMSVQLWIDELRR